MRQGPVRWTEEESMKIAIFVKTTEFVAFILSATFACLWIYNPSGPYEPPLAAAGVVFLAAELYGRYGLQNCTAAPPLTKDEVVSLACRLHDANFRLLPEKIKTTSRGLRAKCRYDSSHGMKEIGAVMSSAVATFLDEFELNMKKARFDETVVSEILFNLSSQDTRYVTAAMEEHFSARVGSHYLSDVINATVEHIMHQYQDAIERLIFERRVGPTTTLESDAAK